MDTDIEYELMNGIGKIHGLGQIDWKDQTVTRLGDSGMGVGLGFGVGLVLALVIPSLFKGSRKTYLTVAGTAAAVSVASSLIPVEGKFFDKLSLISGGLAGTQLAHAAIG